mmetsp:Transcript_9402/g.28594  ORF Transcript_9402/g.28594 Transcript_9402/m.28594 type:complete len:262 (+) Transcript_9402:1394-2179(+)
MDDRWLRRSVAVRLKQVHAVNAAYGHEGPLLQPAPAAVRVRLWVACLLKVDVRGVWRHGNKVARTASVHGDRCDGRDLALCTALRDRVVVDPHVQLILGETIVAADSGARRDHRGVMLVLGVGLSRAQPLVGDEGDSRVLCECHRLVPRIEHEQVAVVARHLVAHEAAVLLELGVAHHGEGEANVAHAINCLANHLEPSELRLARRMPKLAVVSHCALQDQRHEDDEKDARDGNDDGNDHCCRRLGDGHALARYATRREGG